MKLIGYIVSLLIIGLIIFSAYNIKRQLN